MTKKRLTFSQKLQLLKRVLRGENVTHLCLELGISRAYFYKFRKAFAQGKLQKSVSRRKKLTAREKLAAIKKIEEGARASQVCQQLGISRTLFYRWLKRKSEAEEGKELEALANRAPIPHRFARLTPPEVEKKLLELVSLYPQLSAHKLVAILPLAHGKPLLSNKGVQNVLRRRQLSTYEQRLAYARLAEPAIRPRISIDDIFSLPPRLWRMLFAPFETIPKRSALFLKAPLLLVVAILSFYFYKSFHSIITAPTGTPVGTFLAFVSLTFGLFFFIYSLKYYLAAVLVLRLVQTGSGKAGMTSALSVNLEKVKIEKRPFVSIHVPLYNEKRVVERLIGACTSQAWPNYELIIADDSTDETTEIAKRLLVTGGWFLVRKNDTGSQNFDPVSEDLEAFVFSKPNGPTVKLIHRNSRAGFKGGALQKALEQTDGRAEYIVVFDADFVPYPDTIEQFVKYFALTQSTPISADEELINSDIGANQRRADEHGDNRIAAVQGYQWHVLNKSQTWVTRGVRTEYAGSYVIERSATEIYGGLKQIAGSVYAVRADVLRQFGWGTSITEDFQLTLRLYEAGYKVAFTPFIQAPAEAVSTVKKLIRQRMRWAEGASHNIKRMLPRMLFGKYVDDPVSSSQSEVGLKETRREKVWVPSRLTAAEKLEFAYLAPYYLQAVFFVAGTFAWFLSEIVMQSRLPFWTAALGWSLVFTNLLSLPLMNIIGLFLEEGEERDYLGILSFIALSYIVVPFQAYAAIKGFLESGEGPWFRTPKTGLITDVFDRSHFSKFFQGIIGRPRPAVARSNFAFASAYNRFADFRIRPSNPRWLGKVVLCIFLVLSVTVYSYSHGVPEILATNPSGTFLLYNDLSAVITATTSWQLIDTSTRDTLDTTTTVSFAKNAANSTFMQWQPGANNSTTQGTDCSSVGPDGKGWIFDTQFGDTGQIASGTWTFAVRESDGNSNPTGHLEICVWRVTVSGGSISASTLLFSTEGMTGWPTTDMWNAAVNNPSQTTATVGPFNFNNEYLYVEYYSHVTADGGPGGTRSATFATGDVAETNDPQIVTPAITIPENAVFLAAAAPFIPMVVLWMRKRKALQVTTDN